MSSQSLAVFRTGIPKDLQKLADQHLEHDLTENDRDVLKSASTKFARNILLGSIAGLTLGGTLAFRARANRVRMFEAFKTAQKPTHVKFADGREEALPDITPFLQPSALGDVVAYLFFGTAGLFVGGELGIWAGAASARRTITSDPETKARIEKAYRGFRADVLRKEIQALEGTGAEKNPGEPTWGGDLF